MYRIVAFFVVNNFFSHNAGHGWRASSVSRVMAQVMTILASLGIKRSGFDHFPVMVVFFFSGKGWGVRFFAFRVPTVYSPGWRIHGFWRTMIITWRVASGIDAMRNCNFVLKTTIKQPNSRDGARTSFLFRRCQNVKIPCRDWKKNTERKFWKLIRIPEGNLNSKTSAGVRTWQDAGM